MTGSAAADGKKQFVIIALARYYNLLVEYLLLVVTAVLLSPNERGEYVMLVSTVAFFTLIAGLAYEQYGAAFINKYPQEFDGRNYFTIIVILSGLIGTFAGIFTVYWLKAPIATGLLVALNVVALNLGKQSVVHFQTSNIVSQYFGRFILYKSLYFALVFYAALTAKSVEILLFFILVANVVFLFAVDMFSGKQATREVSIQKFMNNLARIKYLYVTAVITACYSFVDIYIVYTRLDAPSLSAYNLAMQLNMAVAVVGQAYNVHLYSQKRTQDISVILSSMLKVNIYIVGVSVVCIGVVNMDFFAIAINLIFGAGYEHLPKIIHSTIWVLPASLVSMFYAPIWISSEQYLVLLAASIGGLLIFTLSALAMVDQGIQGIIYAQYVTAVYIVVENVVFYRYSKNKLGISSRYPLAVDD